MEQPTPAQTDAPTAGPGTTPPPATEPPKRRGRGRPVGARTQSAPLSETPVADVSEPPPQPQQRRRRSKAVDTDLLAKQLTGVHEIAAKVTGLPFIKLDQQEAKILADAIAGVAREYDLALDGKTGAMIQLLAAGAIVYGPRVIVFQRMKREMLRNQGVTVEGTSTSANGAAAPAHD
jgi:hypothetical protein